MNDSINSINKILILSSIFFIIIVFFINCKGNDDVDSNINHNNIIPQDNKPNTINEGKPAQNEQNDIENNNNNNNEKEIQNSQKSNTEKANTEIVIINDTGYIFDYLLEDISKKFNDANVPDIKIRVLEANKIDRLHLNPFSVTDKKYNGYADLIITNPYNISEWYNEGYLLSSAQLNFDKSIFMENTLYDYYASNNHSAIALPVFAHKLQLLYYNKKFVETVPNTLIEANKNITKKNSSDDIISIVYSKDKAIHLIPFLFTNNFYKARNIRKLIDKLSETINHIRNIYKEGLLFNKDISYEEAEYLFRDGKVAFIVNGDWCINPYSKSLGDNLGIAQIPPISENISDTTYYASVKYAFVSSHIKDNTEKLKVTEHFLNFLTSKEIQQYIMNKSELTSPLKSLLVRAEANKENQSKKARLKALSNSVIFTSEGYKNTVFKLMQAYIIPLLEGDKSINTVNIFKDYDLNLIKKYLISE